MARKEEETNKFSGETTYVYKRAGGVLYLVFFSQYEDKALTWTNKFDNCSDGFKLLKPHCNGTAIKTLTADMVLPPGGTATCLISYKDWDV